MPTMEKRWVIQAPGRKPWIPEIDVIDDVDYLRISKRDAGFAAFVGVNLREKPPWQSLNFIDTAQRLRNDAVTKQIQSISQRADDADPYADTGVDIVSPVKKSRKDAIESLTEQVVSITMPALDDLDTIVLKVATSSRQQHCLRIELTQATINYLFLAGHRHFENEHQAKDHLHVPAECLTKHVKFNHARSSLWTRYRIKHDNGFRYKFHTRKVPAVRNEEVLYAMVKEMSAEMEELYMENHCFRKGSDSD